MVAKVIFKMLNLFESLSFFSFFYFQNIIIFRNVWRHNHHTPIATYAIMGYR